MGTNKGWHCFAFIISNKKREIGGRREGAGQAVILEYTFPPTLPSTRPAWLASLCSCYCQRTHLNGNNVIFLLQKKKGTRGEKYQSSISYLCLWGFHRAQCLEIQIEGCATVLQGYLKRIWRWWEWGRSARKGLARTVRRAPSSRKQAETKRSQRNFSNEQIWLLFQASF